MTASAWACLAAACVFAVLDWVAEAERLRRLERVARPLVLLALLAAAAVAHPAHPRLHPWLVLALLLSLVGDLALALEARPAAVTALAAAGGRSPGAATAPLQPKGPRPPSEAPPVLVLAGLVAFLLALLSYAVALQRYGTDQLSTGFGLALVLIAVLSFGYRIMAGGQLAGGSWLVVGITLYVVALGSVVVLGVGTQQLRIAAGVVLFAVSNLTLAYDRFVAARPWAPVTALVTYHAAQVLLLLGLLS